MTSTPFPKFKLAEDSNASELEVIASSGKGLVNNEQISGIIQVSGEKRQKHLTRSSDSLSMLRVDLFQKSCLNLKAIVNGSNYTLSQYNISNLFPSSKSSHSLCNDHVIDSSAANVSRHSTSKMAIQNVSVTTQTKHEIAEAKAKLLKLCKQDSVVQFSEVFKWSSLNVKKIGEGTYGEVFIITKGKTSTVVKIIPVSEEIGDDSFQGLQNVLSEVKIAQSLSGLRNKKINQTKNFNKLKSAHLVMGQYPDVLINAWDSFSEAKSTYNDRPDFFSEAQLFVILEQEYGGKDMSNFVLRHAVEAESVFKQIAISLAIAEEEFLFEHRDLHLGNILIQRNRSKKISYVLRGKPFSIESHGLLVTIIDFTLSRLCETEYVYYNNLADDESLFNQSGDYQFEIYKAMKEHLGNKWHECGLYSNVLWLNFLCVKLKSFPYSRPSSAKHTKALKQLESMEKQLSYCNSATDCLSQCKIVTLPDTNGNRDTRLSSNSILVSRNSFQKSKASIIA
ncbi:serine/threonine-protein kinase haspin-like [Uloborus diversus]|uniref:serine/threonine-protein kinase haspin-like n=1 Tax=Uloborus diversus TaxID=327109 RepID=UPI0024091E67|nr:serine/threonine-protein kinase haspin-like [Uloborus diversus]